MVSNVNKEAEDALQGVRQKIGKLFEKQDAVQISTYVSSKKKREDGEVWEEDGKQWEMKNGIAQSISKLQDAKRPWWCPDCNKTMRGKADDRSWTIFGKCHICVLTEETERRINGTWQLYQRLKMIENSISYVTYHLEQFKDLRSGLSNPKNYFQDGRWEEMKLDLNGIREELDEDIEGFMERINELQEIRDGVAKLLAEREYKS